MRRRAKQAVKTLIKALPVPALCRLLTRRRLGAAKVVVCFDVEPDDRQINSRAVDAWDGLERFLPLVGALRRDLASESGGTAPAFNWFLRMDPQIAEVWGTAGWLAEAHGDELRGLAAAGDEIGLHTHVWRRNGDGWEVDYRGHAARDSVTMALDAFEGAFARAPSAHRAGDRAMSGEMLGLLGERGVAVDLTVEPGLPPDQMLPREDRWRGERPDFRRAPVRPYRASAQTFPQPDGAASTGPLLVPLAMYPTRAGRRPLWLHLQPMLFALRLATVIVRDQPSVLAFAARTDADLVDYWQHVTANLRHLARYGGVRFVAASALA